MYNIKKGVWHNLAGNEQMMLLIVENADTSKGNSDFFPCHGGTCCPDVNVIVFSKATPHNFACESQPSFCSISSAVRKWEIHTVFLHFRNF